MKTLALAWSGIFAPLLAILGVLGKVLSCLRKIHADLSSQMAETRETASGAAMAAANTKATLERVEAKLALDSTAIVQLDHRVTVVETRLGI